MAKIRYTSEQPGPKTWNSALFGTPGDVFHQPQAAQGGGEALRGRTSYEGLALAHSAWSNLKSQTGRHNHSTTERPTDTTHRPNMGHIARRAVRGDAAIPTVRLYERVDLVCTPACDLRFADLPACGRVCRDPPLSAATVCARNISALGNRHRMRLRHTYPKSYPR